MPVFSTLNCVDFLGGGQYYTSFEEDVTQTNVTYSKTGRKSHAGAFTLTIPSSSCGYNEVIISYWGKTADPSAPWVYVEQKVNTGGGANYTIGSTYAYIDEVRMYPVGSLMSTYTYDPLVGMTSSMDSRGETTYYEYDAFNRLKSVKDDDGKVLNQNIYHYIP